VAALTVPALAALFAFSVPPGGLAWAAGGLGFAGGLAIGAAGRVRLRTGT